MADIIKISGLNKFYNKETHALKDIDLNVKEGEFAILLGLSGSGKSTLLRCINRLIEPTSGKIVFKDHDITALTTSELPAVRSRIGMIFQQFNLIKNLSVMTNVLTGRLGQHSLFKPWTKEEKELALLNLNALVLNLMQNEK